MQLDTSTSASSAAVAALLRRPEVVVRHAVMAELREAGFDDVLPAHLGVFQHPGPDGQRPGELATRCNASKQAMNHLLHQLESGGYLTRESHPDDRRTRVVRLTDRGWAAWEVIATTQRDLERQWREAIGEERFKDLADALACLQRVLEPPKQPRRR